MLFIIQWELPYWETSKNFPKINVEVFLVDFNTRKLLKQTLNFQLLFLGCQDELCSAVWSETVVKVQSMRSCKDQEIVMTNMVPPSNQPEEDKYQMENRKYFRSIFQRLDPVVFHLGREDGNNCHQGREQRIRPCTVYSPYTTLYHSTVPVQ